MAKNVNITIGLEGLDELTLALGRAKFEPNTSYTNRLLEGVLSGQFDRYYVGQRTLAASASEDLDFSGALTNPLGQTAVMARLKVLIVSAAVGNTNNVNVSRPASNGVPLFLAASDGMAVAPGETKVLLNRYDATGIVVTAGTGDLITFANSGAGTPVTYDIFAFGCSA